MATEQVKQSINIFAGGMDLDSSDQTLQSGKYRLSKNLRFVADGGSNEGRLTIIPGLSNPMLNLGMTVVGLGGGKPEHLVGRAMWAGSIGDIGVVICRSDKVWWISRFKLGDTMPTVVFGPCTFALWDEDGNDYTLSVVTSDENENVKKLYIADGHNPIAVVNIMKNYSGGDYELITTTPKINLMPMKFAGYCDGSIKSGMVQYAYRLIDKYIRYSVVSPFTGLIPVGNFNKDQKDNKYDTKCCGVKLFVPNTEDCGYSHIRIYRIYQKSIETQPVVYLLQDVPISDQFYYLDQDDSQVVDELQVEELYDSVDITPQYIESKNNRLFAANTQRENTDSLFEKWDARAYQFDEDGVCTIYNYTNRDDFEKFSYDWINENGKFPDIPKTYDCFNEVNDVNEMFSAEKGKCLYTKEGTYFGGSGPNVSWTFIKGKLDFTSDNDQNYPFINMQENARSVSDGFTVWKIKPDGEDDEYGKILLGGIQETGKEPGRNSYKNPYISYAMKSLRRDELYRYGIILYDDKDRKSEVKWIADIRVPSASTPGFETFKTSLVEDAYGDHHETSVFPIGILFEVENLPDECTKYEIVRCRVRGEDIATITQGIIQKPLRKLDPDDDDEYFSSGLYTVCPYVTSSMDVMNPDIMRSLYHIYKPTGLDGKWYPQAYPGITKSLDDVSKADFSTTDEYEKIDKTEASNVTNNNLFCLASPEITFYPDSFKQLLEQIDNIQTLSYIYPLEQYESCVCHHFGNIAGYGVVGHSAQESSIQNLRISEDHLSLPLGLRFNLDPLKRVTAEGIIDTEYTILRDSPLLTASANYGLVGNVQSGENVFTYGEIEQFPYVIDDGGEYIDTGKKISELTTGAYISNIRGDYNKTYSYEVHKIRCNNTIYTPEFNSVRIYDKKLEHNTFLLQMSDVNITGANAEKIIYDKYKETDRRVATSFAYAKLLNATNKVVLLQYNHGKDNVYTTSDKTVVENVNVKYDIQHPRVVKMLDQTVIPSTNSSEYIGMYKFTNAVLNGLGSVKRNYSAICDAVSPEGLIRGHLPLLGTFPVLNEKQLNKQDQFEIVFNDGHTDAMLGRTVTGLSGECMCFELNNENSILASTVSGTTDLCSHMGTYLTNVRKNITPYGGFGQSNISTSVYNSYGNVFFVNKEHHLGQDDTVVFDGNCYISAFEYCSMYKYAGNTGEKIMMYNHFDEQLLVDGGYLTKSNYYCFPVETSMNLNLQYGNSVSDQVYKELSQYGGVGTTVADYTVVEDDKIYYNALKPTMTQYKADMVRMNGTTYSHDRDHYLFNNSYQNDNSAGIHAADDVLTTEEIVEFNRCYYSKEKQPLDIVDGYLHFQSANYIDVDNRYGPITQLKEFKNQLLFWQESAFGVFSVNERVQVNTPNSQTLQLGTGGVLDRYDYYSNFYGMKDGDQSVVTSSSQLYWWDRNKKTLLNYQGGNIVNMNLTHKINTYFTDNKYGDFTDEPRLFYDRDNNEVLFQIKDDNLVYNETIGQFTSLYTFEYDKYISFYDNHMLISRIGLVSLWNTSKDNRVSTQWSNSDPFLPYVQYVVNGEAQMNKVFDNQDLCGNLSGAHGELLDVTISYRTPLGQEGYACEDDITKREMEYRLAVPRDGLLVPDGRVFGGRLRGKTMVVTIESQRNDLGFALDYIITKFRRSLT